VKNNSILKSLVLVKTALLLGFATISLTVGDKSSTARAEDPTPAPIQGSWLTAIARINQGEANFTAVVSMPTGGVWQATVSNEQTCRCSGRTRCDPLPTVLPAGHLSPRISEMETA
jgi:hypothetical protein